ncbi:Hypothetical predicted protein [Pelobates cultripes]|nr:Hypothetical predicted protein [Pelobates cultripes]
MLAVGYLNPFGTIGLSILGAGAVLYFGTILFLVFSCLSVQRKYPGMQPLSFRIPTRRPGRPPPTTVGNPNISGQIPIPTITSYRIHNDLPAGFKDVPGKTCKVLDPTDNSAAETNKAQNQDDQVDPEFPHGSYGLESGDTSAGQTPQTLTNIQGERYQIDLDEESSISIPAKGESQVESGEQLQNVEVDTKDLQVRDHTQGNGELHSEQHSNQDKKQIKPPVSPKTESRGNKKTHHIEVPFDEYPSSDSSEAKEKQNVVSVAHAAIQSTRPEGSSPQNKSSVPLPMDQIQDQADGKIERICITAVSPTAAVGKNEEKREDKKYGNVQNRPYITDNSTATQALPQKERKPQASNQDKDLYHPRKNRSPQRDKIHQCTPDSVSFTDSSSPSSPNLIRKHVPAVQKNSVSPPIERKAAIQQKRDQPLLGTSQEAVAAPNPSPNIQRKHLQPQKYKTHGSASGESHTSRELHSPDSSPRNKRRAASNERVMAEEKTHKISHIQYPSTDLTTTSSRTQASSQVHSTQNRRDHFNKSQNSPGPGISVPSSGTKKTASPTRTQQIKQDHRVRHSQDIISSDSPPGTRKPAASSPQRHRHRSPDIPQKSPRTQNKTDNLNNMHGKKIIHKSESSQSSDVPSSQSSPLTAKKLLQYKTEKAHQELSSGTRSQSSDSESSGVRRIQRQEGHQCLDKTHRSPRSRETSPAAVKRSSPSNKKSPSHQKRDQL